MKKTFLIFGVFFIWAINCSAQTTVVHDLTMWTSGTYTLWDGNSVKYYGFGPGHLVPPIFPSPILYANEGDTVIVNVRNQSQRAPHTIHWHGLDVDQANDGVAGTSFSIYHSQDTNYTFIAPHAGTYLYHCHVATIVHVQMGMYGSFIVRPVGGGDEAWTGGPSYDKEYNWLISEFDKSWHDSIPLHDSTDTAFAYFHVPQFEPDYFLINGLSKSQLSDSSTSISGKVGEKIFLRLSNIGFYMNRIEFPPSLDARVISSDGRDLAISLDQDTLWLTPGERYGVMLNPSIEMEDSILVSYVNMDNYQSWDIERVPVSINGFIGIDPPEDSGMFISVYPNPNNGSFLIQSEDNLSQDLQIELLDCLGREVYSGSFINATQGKTKEIRTNGLESGIYVLRINSGSSTFQSKICIYK